MGASKFTEKERIEIAKFAQKNTRKEAQEKYNVAKGTLNSWINLLQKQLPNKTSESAIEPIEIKQDPAPPKEKRTYKKREPIYQPIEPVNKAATKNFLFYSEDAASVLEVLKGLL